VGERGCVSAPWDRTRRVTRETQGVDTTPVNMDGFYNFHRVFTLEES
jgi:hypothetical protein